MNFLRVKVRWVVINEWKVFLCKLAKWDFYCLPWWTLEQWETLKECLKREFIEELWVKPKIWERLYFQEFFSNEKANTTIDFWFKVNNYKDFLNIDLSKTSHWFELSEAWFYDLEEIENYRPDWLKDLVKMWIK